MAKAAFNNYLSAVGTAIDQQNGPELMRLLSFSNTAVQSTVAEFRTQGVASGVQWDPRNEVVPAMRRSGVSGKVWLQLVVLHCQAFAARGQGNNAEAYARLTDAWPHMSTVFQEDKEAWLVQPLYGMARSLRTAALAADEQAQKRGQKTEHLEACGTLLRNFFAIAMQSHGNKAKRLATLEIVITAFKVYFRLNTLRLCKNLINAVQSKQFLPFDSFPAAQRVTYKYYTGRLAIFDEAYDTAEADLSYALAHCAREAHANRMRILYYLVPIKMLLGSLPTDAALDRFGLQEYAPICEAMRTGNVRLLNESLDANQWHFIRAGTFLVLEKLRQAVFRRLLKRVAQIHAQAEPAKANQIPIVQLQRALEWLGMAMELDEVECMVANLIYRKYVKGYISHQKRILVVSKVDAFPSLTNALLSDPM